MEKTLEVNFKAFKMARFSAQWQPGSLENMHSSNPEPLSWDELSELSQVDLSALLQTTAFNYESTQGNPALREQISDAYYSQVSQQDIVLTSGAQEAIYLLMNALLAQGDEVITFTPCFEPLAKVAENVGAKVALIALDEQQGWQIDWQLLESTFSDKTQLLIINFPHNPTGKNISRNELDRLITLCEKHNCWLFSDEVFKGLEHDENHCLPAAVDLYDKAISMGVMSKALALPGIRIGWLVSKSIELVEQLLVVKSHLSICQSSLDAHLCQAIIPISKKLWKRNLTIIKCNKDHIAQLLINHKSMTWHKPEGSATAFIQLRDQAGDEFAHKLANNKGLFVMPNEAFLTAHSGFRLTLGKSDSKLLIDQILD